MRTRTLHYGTRCYIPYCGKLIDPNGYNPDGPDGWTNVLSFFMNSHNTKYLYGSNVPHGNCYYRRCEECFNHPAVQLALLAKVNI